MTIVTGRAIVLRGDDIGTTQILPDRFRDAADADDRATHAFEDVRRNAERAGLVHPFDDPQHDGARVLMVGANFGAGDAAELAARALHDRGIKAIVGESFAESFVTGALHVGIPCVAAAHRDLVALRTIAETTPSEVFDVDIERQLVLAEGQTAVPVHLSPSCRHALMSGSWEAR